MVEGVLERINQVTRFTAFTTFAKLQIPAGGDTGKARDLLGRAERARLVANSLVGSRRLELQVAFASAA